MSISKHKVVLEDYIGRDIASLPDEPGSGANPLSGAQLRERFDKVGKEVLAAKMNLLIDALLATTTEDSGAANIGSEAIAGIEGATVRAQLINLKKQIDGVVLGSITDGTITDVKLSGDAADIKSRFTAHAANYALHLKTPTATTRGTAAAYTLTDTDFDISKNYILAIIPHVDCAASATLNISGAGARYIRTAALANVAAGQMKANGLYLLIWLQSISTSFFLVNPETIIPAVTSAAAFEITGNVAANDAQVVNTYYSTSSTPPDGVPDGTLFIQYTA